MTLRIGVIGCGHGAAYVKAFTAIQDKTVVALTALPDDQRRTEVAKRYTIPAIYDDMQTMLEKENLDIVVIASPPRYHRDHICAALEAGAHVLCEKPPAMSAHEASVCYFRSMYVEKHLEWAFCYRQMRNLPPPRPHLSTVHVRFRRTSGPTTAWSNDPATAGGGCLTDIGSHAIDLGLYALGDPVPVAASGVMYNAAAERISAGVEYVFTGVIETEGGRRLSLDISWLNKTDDQVMTCAGRADAAPPHGGAVADTTPIIADDQIYLRTAHTFLQRCFSTNRAGQLEVTARGVVVQRCVDSLYLSAAKGHGVRLT